MDTTHRFWAVVGVGSVLATLGVLARAPLLLFGAAGVGAWLVAAQVDALQSFATADRALDVSVVTDRDRVLEGHTVRVTVTARLDRPTPATVTVSLSVPPSVRDTATGGCTLRLAPGDTSAERSFAVDADTVGAVTFDPPTASVAGPRDLFSERVTAGQPTTVLVDPPVPRDVHVGQGGERASAAFGDREGDGLGVGLDPAELREYLPGDPLSRVDWNATARQGAPYVREYESENETELALVVSHGRDMARGAPGQTMLDYAKEVALGVTAVAEAHADPVGLYAVDDQGLTVRRHATTTREGYRRIEQQIRSLDADTADRTTDADTADRTTDADTRADLVSPATAQTFHDRLQESDEAYAAALRPFFETIESYVTRIEGDPRFETVQTVRSRSNASVTTVLVTDDRDRAGIYETVRIAARDDGEALVFLTPHDLFDPGALTDLDALYDRYHDFEAFRRRLDSLPNVTAYEVAPGDRLDALFTSRVRKHEQS